MATIDFIKTGINNFTEFFEYQAIKNPDNPAIKFGNTTLTYKELNSKINGFATYLKSKGISHNDHIGINLPPNPDTITSIISLMKIGAVYIPLDPAYPAERLKFIIEDGNIKALLSDKNNNTSNLESKIINVADIKADNNDNLNLKFSDSDLAYIIYTSGSSGKPKGVRITNFNLFNFIKNSASTLEVKSSDICLQSASINYALSVRQIFVPLAYGAKLVIASFSEIQDPEKLLSLIKREYITIADFVPSHFRSILYYLISLPKDKRDHLLKNNLRRIITVGEPLTADLLNIWYNDLKQTCPVVNIMGQTETTGIICCNYTSPGMEYKGIIPIGKPIDQTEIYVVDENLKEVEVGQIGELCVSNPCVGEGYLNRNNLTKQKFVKNHFNPLSSFPLYLTGDLVRLRDDGNIDYLGRKDNQIKIRGMRVEVGEIEAVLNDIQFVQEASVIAQTDENSTNKLIAFLIPRNDNHLDIISIKNYLKSVLPSHMVPSELQVLNDFPRTPNGKIDKLKLAALIIDHKKTADISYEFSETENKLIEIWKKVLRSEKMSIEDNFFDSGGDSLSAVNLFILIEQEFNRHLPVSVLYEHPDIISLSKVINSSPSEDIYKALVPIRKDGSKPPLFFIHGAGGNILLYKDLVNYLDPDIPFYGLQSYGLDGKSEILSDIKQIAKLYLTEILQVQRKGPYFLGGYCMGGTVALEIAQQLKQQGQDVSALFLLETYNWCALPGRGIDDKVYFNFQRIVFHFNNVRLLSGKEFHLFLGNKIKGLKNRVKIWTGKIRNRFSANTKGSPQFNSILAVIWEHNDLAAFNYQSTFYDGEIIHILPIKRYKVHNTPLADWNKMAKSIKVITLPIYAAGMLVEPFVKTLAQKMNSILIEKYKNINFDNKS